MEAAGTESPAFPRVPPSPHEAAFYGEGSVVVAPASREEIGEIIRDAEARRVPVVPAGLGIHAYLGNPPPPGAIVVSLRRMARVLRYEPGDFTIGVEAGLPLSALRDLLLENGQEIPADIPRSLEAGTTGGLVATARPGPRRSRNGPVRSFIIGAAAMRGGGSSYRTGAMVVKNVAGYEVMKLLTGAMGTAGVLLEVNFKLRPLPARRRARVASFDTPEALWRFLGAMRASRIEPAALWALGGGAPGRLRGDAIPGGLAGPTAAWLLEGNEAAIEWQEREADRLLLAGSPTAGAVLSGADLDRLLDELLGFPEPGPRPPDQLGIARLACLPTAAPRLERAAIAAVESIAGLAASVAADAASGLLTVRWEGPLEHIAAPVPLLAAAAREIGGTAVLLYLPPSVRRSHPYLLAGEANAPVAARLLAALDPAGVFSPGRIVAAS